jgi:glycosyltransferase involved in cell wall biosynthesis
MGGVSLATTPCDLASVRILHVIGSLSPRDGGPSTVLPEMCRALARRGHYVEIVTTNLDGNGVLDVPVSVPILRDGITTTYYPIQVPRSYDTSIPMALMLRTRIMEFDVVHVHSLYLFHTLIASALCRRQGVPYVIRPHGTLDPYHRSVRRWRKAVYDMLFERRNLAGAAAIHYTSDGEQAFAEEAGVRTSGYVIPHGIDLRVFDDKRDEDLAAVPPDPEGRVLITFLGRLTEKKGLDILLKAFAQVSTMAPRAQLVIAGPDNEGLALQMRRWIDERGIADRVSMPGLVTGHAKVELLRRSDVFVLPSRDENFGVTVAEALAARTAVIVTRGVALHEEIERAHAGLVTDRTPNAVAAALLRLLNDGRLRTRLAENGRALVEHSYSWGRACERLEGMYAAAVATRGEPSVRLRAETKGMASR